MTPEAFIERLRAMATEDQRHRYRTTPNLAPANTTLGVPMGQVFALAKEHASMSNDDVVELLRSDIHEAKVGAVSIMDFQARSKRTSPEQRRWLFDTYLADHAFINSWDLVDRAAQHVVGGYLHDHDGPREVLDRCAASADPSQRRTAIVATLYLIRKGVTADTFRIAERLIGDDVELIRMAVGGVLREAGKKDRPGLLRFLDRHAPTMARITLRYATEKLPDEEKAHYRGMAG